MASRCIAPCIFKRPGPSFQQSWRPRRLVSERRFEPLCFARRHGKRQAQLDTRARGAHSSQRKSAHESHCCGTPHIIGMRAVKRIRNRLYPISQSHALKAWPARYRRECNMVGLRMYSYRFSRGSRSALTIRQPLSRASTAPRHESPPSRLQLMLRLAAFGYRALICVFFAA